MTPTQTTKISGYYNPNPFPIVLAINELCQNIQLEPGKFIVDGQGNKINDPLFESYCRPNCLSIEMSPVPVAMRIVARPSCETNNSTYSHSAAQEFTVDRNGNVVSAGFQKQADQPPTNWAPYQEMSIEQAINAGIIRRDHRAKVKESQVPQASEEGFESGDIQDVDSSEVVDVVPERTQTMTPKQVKEAMAPKPISLAQLPAAPIVTSLAESQIVIQPITPKKEKVVMRRKRGEKPKAPEAVTAVEESGPEPEI